MGKKALSTTIAEVKIKDVASKNVKKLEKNLDKANKKLLKTEKQSKKTDRAMTRLGNSFRRTGQRANRFSKSRGAQRGKRAGQAGGRATGRAGSGGGAAFAGIPVIGGIIAGGIAALSASKNRFVQSVALKKELRTFTNDWQLAFGGQAKEVLKLTKNEKGFFQKRDLKKAFTGLKDAGVSGDSIVKNTGILRKFAKAQGFTNIESAVGALKGGQVKAGRGVGGVDIARIQAVAPLLQNVLTAEQGFKLITEILKESEGGISKFAKGTENALGGVQRQSVRVQEKQENLTLSTAGTEKVFNASLKVQKKLNNLQNKMAKITAGAINLISDAVKGLEKLIGGKSSGGKGSSGRARRRALEAEARKKEGGGGSSRSRRSRRRQAGGPTRAQQAYLVGEAGPELFTPSTSGSVMRADRTASATAGQGGTENHFHVSVTVPLDSLGSTIENEVMKALNKAAKTSLRYNSGLPLRG